MNGPLRLLHPEGRSDASGFLYDAFANDPTVDVVSGDHPNQPLRNDDDISSIVITYPFDDGVDRTTIEALTASNESIPIVLVTETCTSTFIEEAVMLGLPYLSLSSATHSDGSLKQLFECVIGADERRTADHETRTAAIDRYKLITETAVDGIYILDENYQFGLVNSALVELTGYSREELVAAHISLIVDDAAIERSKTLRSRLKRGTERDAVMEAEIHRKDGDTVICEFRYAPIINDDVFEGTVGLVTDISERKQTGSELKASEEYWRSIFDESLNSVVVTDDNGDFVDVNDAACELFGCSRTDLIGQSIADFPDPTFDFDEAWGPLHDSKEERGSFRLLRPDGTTRIVEYSTTPNVVDGRHLSILRDVTDRLLRMQRLQVLQRILRHNLRNELTVVNGHVSKLEAAIEDDELRLHVETVREVTKELMALSETVHNVQKSLDGDTQFVEVDVAQLVETEARDILDRYPGASIKVANRADAMAVVDSAFQFAVRELIENAVIHNETSNPTVDVVVSRENGSVRVDLTDDGPGIPDVEADVLVSGAETPLEHASGLGLWFVKWLVTRSGGQLDIEDLDPRGTRVSISLPSAN